MNYFKFLSLKTKERQNLKTSFFSSDYLKSFLNFNLSLWISFLSLIFIFSTLSSCQNSKTRTNPTKDRTVCTHCNQIRPDLANPTGQILLENVQGNGGQTLSFHLQIHGTPSPYCTQPPEKQILCAQGAASISGLLRLTSPYLCLNNASYPPGDYTIKSLEPSQITNATLMGGHFALSGPSQSQLYLQLQTGILYNLSGSELGSQSNRIGLTGIIYGSNGSYCGMVYTF
jgi:hypothetical protein